MSKSKFDTLDGYRNHILFRFAQDVAENTRLDFPTALERVYKRVYPYISAHAEAVLLEIQWEKDKDRKEGLFGLTDEEKEARINEVKNAYESACREFGVLRPVFGSFEPKIRDELKKSEYGMKYACTLMSCIDEGELAFGSPFLYREPKDSLGFYRRMRFFESKEKSDMAFVEGVQAAFYTVGMNPKAILERHDGLLQGIHPYASKGRSFVRTAVLKEIRQ